MTPGAAGRRQVGFTLLETLIALLLGWLLASLALATLAGQRVAQERLSRRAEALSASRTARHLLTRELRPREPGEVSWSLPSDSLGVRAYRGLAWVCPQVVPAGEVRVVSEGARAPDPGKDSVWILGDRGDARVLALAAVTAEGGACREGLGPSAERWTLSGPPPSHPVLALYFERGSLHLSGGALRYRRGYGGRQPITAESLLTPPSSFQAWGAGVAARLVSGESGGRAESVVTSVAPVGGGPGG